MTTQDVSKFITSYEDLIDGSWRSKWEEFQQPRLPKHLIDRKDPRLMCTCGSGPFKSTTAWSRHAVGKKVRTRRQTKVKLLGPGDGA